MIAHGPAAATRLPVTQEMIARWPAIDRVTTYSQGEIERFLAKVAIRGEPDCWLWTSNTNAPSRRGGVSGYGSLARDHKAGSPLYAHRMSYELATGEAPGRLFVCHRCDTRLCVNPAHLFLGTLAENQADMAAKGRAVRRFGEATVAAKLTETQVLEIRQLFAEGSISKSELARRFGVSTTLIRLIVQGKRWPHLAGR